MIFNDDGKFKIMQITDIQDVPKVSKDSLRLIEKALDLEKPDLVVLTGDQLKGYSTHFKGKKRHEKVRQCIETIVSPMTARNIPFALTYGNHDQSALDEKEQTKIYRASPLCLNPEISPVAKDGTFNIPIFSKNDEAPIFNIYLLHSGRDAKGGGYDPPDADAIEWYKRVREELKQANGSYVPSLVFQHIPLPEFYHLLKKVTKRDKNARRAYRTHKNEYFILDEKNLKDGEFMLETPSIPDKDIGQFAAMSEKGDVLGIWVGHDHINSYSGKYKGIELGYTQNCGFNVYGPSTLRGVRIFEIDQNDPKEYKTHTLTYEQLFGKKVAHPLKNYFYSHTPTTVDAAIPMIIKGLLILGAILSGIFILTNGGK